MDDAAEVTWYVWKNDSDERLSKIVEEGTTDDLRTYISSILPQFMEHCYSKREQAAAYKLERGQLKVVRMRHSCRLTFQKTIRVNTRMRHNVLIGSNIK